MFQTASVALPHSPSSLFPQLSGGTHRIANHASLVSALTLALWRMSLCWGDTSFFLWWTHNDHSHCRTITTHGFHKQLPGDCTHTLWLTQSSSWALSVFPVPCSCWQQRHRMWQLHRIEDIIWPWQHHKSAIPWTLSKWGSLKLLPEALGVTATELCLELQVWQRARSCSKKFRTDFYLVSSENT